MTNDVDELQREVKRLRGVVKKLVIPKEITPGDRAQIASDILRDDLGITLEYVVPPPTPGNYNILSYAKFTLAKPISKVRLRRLSGHNNVYHQAYDNTGITRIPTRVDANVEMTTMDGSLQVIAPCSAAELKFDT